MIVYRLSKTNFAKDLSGKGAEKAGGRWNSRGVPMIYTSESRALCTTEIAVHIPLGIIPLNYSLITIEIPDSSILELKQNQLAPDWKSFPPSSSTQKIGDKFINDGKFLVMKVPSVVVQGDFNFLINPLNKNISKVKIKKIEAFSFDKRLFVK